jgi:adenosine deaminase
MRMSTLVDLAGAAGLRLPHALTEPRTLALSPDERGWFRFQRLYDAARAAVTTEPALRRVIREAAEDDAAEGSRRLELQIDPTTYGPYVGGITPALEIVMDEARSAAGATGVEIGLIVAASRTRHPLEARTLARLAARHAGDGPGQVVGFGLSNDERRGVTAEFAPAFRIARQAGLVSVPHAGELLGAAHVAEVVNELRPNRLGHGVRAAEDRAVLDRLAASGITLELCPLSNVALGVYPKVESVPVRTIMESGAAVSLSADDPLIFGSRLVDQYEALRSAHGLSDADLAALAKSSIAASRASDATKRATLADIDAWLAAPC